MILDSNFLISSTFPQALSCPELIHECISRYDITSQSILKRDCSVLLSVSREFVSKVFHLEEHTFVDLTPTSSEAKFMETPNVYRNVIARNWTVTFYKGGSRLPKILKKDHMSSCVHDIIVLLHRIIGSPDVLLFQEWMYFFIQIVMEGTQFLDWAELIAHSLRDQLKWALNLKKEFHMSSYLMYMLASTIELHLLSNGPRMGNVLVY